MIHFKTLLAYGCKHIQTYIGNACLERVINKMDIDALMKISASAE